MRRWCAGFWTNFSMRRHAEQDVKMFKARIKAANEAGIQVVQMGQAEEEEEPSQAVSARRGSRTRH
jgi:hypothetical protein